MLLKTDAHRLTRGGTATLYCPMPRVIRAILFDLDNTLYDASAGLQEVGDRRITAWIMERLGVAHEVADALRVRTWREYGTTARGLEVEYGLQQAPLYEHAINQIEPGEHIGPWPELDAMLARLQAERHVFTNSPEAYSRKVLAALGVTHQFGMIFGIERNGWVSKPSPEIYQDILDSIGLPAREVAFVEDNARNLEPALALGMYTVLVRSGDGCAAEVDLCIGSILDLADALRAAGVDCGAPQGVRSSLISQ